MKMISTLIFLTYWEAHKMNIRYAALAVILILAANTQVLAQSAGSSISLQYGTVQSAQEVQAESKHAGGALLGGIAGAVIAVTKVRTLCED
jgi:outer membrane lipoprotein SlyB